MRKALVIFSFLFLGLQASAQLPDRGDGRLLYRKEAVGGIIIHTSGWGIHFRYGLQITNEKKLNFGFDFVNLRHPKEKKVFNDVYDDGKGFYYGKINSLMAFRPTIGLRQVLFPKKREKGVEVGYLLGTGPSLGLVKPVYLEIVYLTNDGSQVVSEEVFDPNRHTVDNIYGRASTFRGFSELKLYPGVFGKAALLFEYANDEDVIKALEVGVKYDYYFRDVPIMALASNKSGYLNFYVSLCLGRKYF